MARRKDDGYLHGPIRHRHQTKYGGKYHKYDNHGHLLDDSDYKFKDVSRHHRRKRK